MNAQKTYEKIYDSDQKMVSEGWMQNGKKQGFWTYYYSNGQIKSAGHYRNDKKDSYWNHYTKNGHKSMEGHMINGKQTDWWIFYDASKIKEKCQFKNGLKHGISIIYSNGRVNSASKYVEGNKIKTWTSIREFKRDNPLKDLQ